MREFIRIIVFILVLCTLSVMPAFAHPNSQEGILAEEYIGDDDYNDYFIGGEEIGWFINERFHSGSASISYKFDGVTASTKTLFRNAAQMWASVATFSESNSSANLVQESNLHRGDIVAQYTGYVYTNDTTGHVVYWTIVFNTYDNITYDSVTAAHELGHVIGITDLHDPINIDKLMYYSNASTATAPTSSDLWGAKVILGIHTTHNFSAYRYWGDDANGNHCHVAYCTDCGGVSATHSACVYLPFETHPVCPLCHTPRDAMG